MDTGVCWSCKVAQAAGYARVSWSMFTGRVPKLRKSKRTNNTTTKAKVDTDSPRNGKANAIAAQAHQQEQRLLLPDPTIKSSVTVSFPKITPAPSLVKRKLGSNHWDAIHERIQGQKRDESQCPASYQSCAPELNGGCCPSDRICGSSSCLPNTAVAVVSGCGRANYSPCGIPDGGGCCPSGYMCATNGCSASPGYSVTSTCSSGYYLCPAEFDHGCCRNGMGCAVSSCYSTYPTTFTLTQTLQVTDANMVVHTFTTTITSQTVVGAPTTTLAVVGGIITKEPAILSNTAMAKVPATFTPSSTPTAGNGLSTPELGSIVGGLLLLLIVTLVAAVLIIRRLNKAIRTNEASGSRPPSRPTQRSWKESMRKDFDELSIDPLIMSPSEASRSVRRSSKQSNLHTTTHELASPESPPAFFHPFENASLNRGYGPIITSGYAREVNGYRDQSIELSPPIPGNPDGYFDAPSPRDSRYSPISPMLDRRPSQHGRQWSDASDQSGASQSSDAAELGDNRGFGFQRGFNKLRRTLTRKQTDPPNVLRGGPTRTDWSGFVPRAGLGFIDEGAEERIALGGRGGGVITNADLREISLGSRPVRYEKHEAGVLEARDGRLGGRSMRVP